jgi:SAM-dependent methyltransferase
VLVAVERVDVDATGSPWREEHGARYLYAAAFVRDQRVLDIACGTGFGAETLLDHGANHVIAADIASDALDATRARLTRFGSRASVECHDATGMSLPDDSVDVVVSFETLEHIHDDVGFLSEIARVLRPGGTVILSTPNALVTLPCGGTPENPFHVREYRPLELRRLVESAFDVSEQVGQHLPPAYGVAPFLPSFDRHALGVRGAWSFLAWRVELRLGALGDRVHRWRTGLPFYPSEGDYTFLSADLERAHVQLIVAKVS